MVCCYNRIMTKNSFHNKGLDNDLEQNQYIKDKYLFSKKEHLY